MPSGHVRRRGKLYQVILELERDPQTQKRRFKYLSGFRTKRDAESEKQRILTEMRQGTFHEPTTLTLAAFIEQWLTSYARVSLTPYTATRYELALRHHVIPHLGSLPLARLSPLHLQDWIATLLKSGRRDGTGGLAVKSARWHLTLLSSVLRRAVLWGVIQRNPADSVEAPRLRTPERRVLTEEETEALLAAVLGTRLYIPVLLAVGTGMRRGEIMALRWSDVDLDAATLRVVASVSWEKGHGYVTREPKTEKGRRRITLPPLLTLALRQHRAAQVENALGMGQPPPPHVCAEPGGALLGPNALSLAFLTFLREKNLPLTRFHDLRHLHATRLLLAHVPLKVVSDRLGHADGGRLALTLYGHVLPVEEDRAAVAADRILGGQREGKGA